MAYAYGFWTFGGGASSPALKLPATRPEAMLVFRALVARYGTEWSARSVPPGDEAWALMHACQELTTLADRREALGYPKLR